MPGQRTMRSRAATLLRGWRCRVAQKRNPTKAACAWWGRRQDKGGEKTRRGGKVARHRSDVNSALVSLCVCFRKKPSIRSTDQRYFILHRVVTRNPYLYQNPR